MHFAAYTIATPTEHWHNKTSKFIVNFSPDTVNLLITVIEMLAMQ